MTKPKRAAASGSNDRVGETKNRGISFEGRTMIVTQGGDTGGARRIMVVFEDGFGSYSARVIRGKQEGADNIVTSSLITRGQAVEIAEVKTSGESCSVKNGNVFGGE